MPPMFRALRHRNYRLWAAADLISVSGSWMQVTGLNWVALERTGSVTSVVLTVCAGLVSVFDGGSVTRTRRRSSR